MIKDLWKVENLSALQHSCTPVVRANRSINHESAHNDVTPEPGSTIHPPLASALLMLADVFVPCALFTCGEADRSRRAAENFGGSSQK